MPFVRRHKHEKALEHIKTLEAENARIDAEVTAIDPTPWDGHDQPAASVGAIDAAINVIRADQEVHAHDVPAQQRRRDVSWTPVVMDDDYFANLNRERYYSGLSYAVMPASVAYHSASQAPWAFYGATHMSHY